MRAFLTSYLGGSYKVCGRRVPGPISNLNGCLDKIKTVWPSAAKVIMVCADPEDHKKNDSNLRCFKSALPDGGLSVSSIEMCDDRTEDVASKIPDSDVVILTGGHVPTQNAFFDKISLRDRLSSFDGLLLAWSAGSMNCAGTVYAGPELPGEAIDPNFQRWIPGLGLTEHNILPHFEMLWSEELDGLRLIEDITFADSMGHEILALDDGSYVYIDEDGREELYGKAYKILDGRIRLICKDGETVEL